MSTIHVDTRQADEWDEFAERCWYCNYEVEYWKTHERKEEAQAVPEEK